MVIIVKKVDEFARRSSSIRAEALAKYLINQ